jgi:small subunit ribosomal protein S21
MTATINPIIHEVFTDEIRCDKLFRKGGEQNMEATEVKLKKGDSIERALRRLKKKLDKEGTLKELRNRRHYEKPSEKKRRTQRRRG